MSETNVPYQQFWNFYFDFMIRQILRYLDGIAGNERTVLRWTVEQNKISGTERFRNSWSSLDVPSALLVAYFHPSCRFAAASCSCLLQYCSEIVTHCVSILSFCEQHVDIILEKTYTRSKPTLYTPSNSGFPVRNTECLFTNKHSASGGFVSWTHFHQCLPENETAWPNTKCFSISHLSGNTSSPRLQPQSFLEEADSIHQLYGVLNRFAMLKCHKTEGFAIRYFHLFQRTSLKVFSSIVKATKSQAGNACQCRGRAAPIHDMLGVCGEGGGQLQLCGGGSSSMCVQGVLYANDTYTTP